MFSDLIYPILSFDEHVDSLVYSILNTRSYDEISLELPCEIVTPVVYPIKIVYKDISIKKKHERMLKNLIFKGRPYTCNFCGRVLTTKNGISLHLKGHLGIKEISCEKCGMTYVQKSSLRNHNCNSTRGNKR